MNRKVQIIDNMLKAAADATKPTAGQFVILRDGIEAALRLLTEELKKMKFENKLPWQAGYNTAVEDILDILPMSKPDPLVMYVMRHFEHISTDAQLIRNCAEAAANDYKEHLKRNPALKEKGPVIQDFEKFEQEIQERRDTEAREACKDLLFPVAQGIPVVLANDCVTVQADVNNRIIQAYNHGKDAGYAERSSETFGR